MEVTKGNDNMAAAANSKAVLVEFPDARRDNIVKNKATTRIIPNTRSIIS